MHYKIALLATLAVATLTGAAPVEKGAYRSPRSLRGLANSISNYGRGAIRGPTRDRFFLYWLRHTSRFKAQGSWSNDYG